MLDSLVNSAECKKKNRINLDIEAWVYVCLLKQGSHFFLKEVSLRTFRIRMNCWPCSLPLDATVNICRSNLHKINLNLELCCGQDGADSQNSILYFCKSTFFGELKNTNEKWGCYWTHDWSRGIAVAFEGWTDSSLVKSPTLVEDLSSVQCTHV